MIGVISRTDQAGVVEEFFELFKTPWEFYRAGRGYDVILITTDEVPDVDAKLVLVYGPHPKSLDARLGAVPGTSHHGALVSDRGAWVPIYGELITFAEGSHDVCCRTKDSEVAGLRAGSTENPVLRLGYDLFDEVRYLLSVGQPIENAAIPSLDIHIRMLRAWILGAGLSLVEIPPAPASYSFAVCLTHDIDFVGIRRHGLDHSTAGFLYRATLGVLRNFLRGRLSLIHVLRSWLAVASLPFVHMGWARDFWEPFAWYLEAEKGLPATYFLIPFKRRPGEKVPGKKASLRATAYDVSDIAKEAALLAQSGHEIGVHGIDSWHSASRGREERGAVTTVTGSASGGIRMHWLLRDASTPSVLERAGYSYDSTFGYNETIGYRAGTGQVFRPLDAQTLLELPMHIQDGALFYPQRLDLTEPEAEKRCQGLIENASQTGGVLTILWHDRSHGPERFWGGFYKRLLQMLKSSRVWFGTAAQVVGWFQKRREVRFVTGNSTGDNGSSVSVQWHGGVIEPPLTVRIHRPASQPPMGKSGRGDEGEFLDIAWGGTSTIELEREISARLSDPACHVSLGSIP